MNRQTPAALDLETEMSNNSHKTNLQTTETDND